MLPMLTIALSSSNSITTPVTSWPISITLSPFWIWVLSIIAGFSGVIIFLSDGPLSIFFSLSDIFFILLSIMAFSSVFFISWLVDFSSSFLISFVLFFSAWPSFISFIVFSIILFTPDNTDSASTRASLRMFFVFDLIPSISDENIFIRSSKFFSSFLIFFLFFSQYLLSLSISLRCLSKLICFFPILLAASDNKSCGRPILPAISKANELPGLPIESSNNGCILTESNSIAPLMIPSSVEAKCFKFE